MKSDLLRERLAKDKARRQHVKVNH
jgi:hypothetical protein